MGGVAGHRELKDALGATTTIGVTDAGVEAIVQVGTDLAMVRQADEAERWLGLPVVVINAALLWHALRACGVADQLRGAGTLLREH